MRFIAALMILSLLCSTVSAIAPVSSDLIEEAMEYGSNNTKVAIDKFAFFWLSYEENAVKLNEQSERAYVYTPYLLVAVNARDRVLSGKPAIFSISSKFLADYDGYLVFSIVLFGVKPDFLGNATVFVKQDTKLTNAQQCNLQGIEKTEGAPQEYTAQMYCYFPVNSITLNTPVLLAVSTADKKLHKFYFDLAKVK